MNYDDGQEPGVGLCDVVCAWLLPAALLFGLFVFSVMRPEYSRSTELLKRDQGIAAEHESGRIRHGAMSSSEHGDQR